METFKTAQLVCLPSWEKRYKDSVVLYQVAQQVAPAGRLAVGVGQQPAAAFSFLRLPAAACPTALLLPGSFSLLADMSMCKHVPEATARSSSGSNHLHLTKWMITYPLRFRCKAGG